MSKAKRKTKFRHYRQSIIIGVVMFIATGGMVLIGHFGCQKAGPTDAGGAHVDASPKITDVPKVPDEDFVLILTDAAHVLRI